MGANAHGDPDVPAPSPYVVEFPDYQGKLIRITVNYDNTTRVISTGSVFRDPLCVYTKIYVGRGVDGSPNTSTHKFNVPSGTTALNKAAFTTVGFNTITEFQALQITAGP